MKQMLFAEIPSSRQIAHLISRYETNHSRHNDITSYNLLRLERPDSDEKQHTFYTFSCDFLVPSWPHPSNPGWVRISNQLQKNYCELHSKAGDPSDDRRPD